MPGSSIRIGLAAAAAALALSMSSAQAVTLKWITFKPENAGDARLPQDYINQKMYYYKNCLRQIAEPRKQRT